jgi:hypothetical protein
MPFGDYWLKFFGGMKCIDLAPFVPYKVLLLLLQLYEVIRAAKFEAMFFELFIGQLF